MIMTWQRASASSMERPSTLLMLHLLLLGSHCIVPTAMGTCGAPHPQLDQDQDQHQHQQHHNFQLRGILGFNRGVQGSNSLLTRVLDRQMHSQAGTRYEDVVKLLCGAPQAVADIFARHGWGSWEQAVTVTEDQLKNVLGFKKMRSRKLLAKMLKQMQHELHIWQRHSLTAARLIASARSGHIDRVRNFLYNGVAPDVLPAPGSKTALHHAAEATTRPDDGAAVPLQDCLAVLQLLMAAGANPNAADSKNITPMKAAVASGRPAVVAYLVSVGGQLSSEVGEDGDVDEGPDPQQEQLARAQLPRNGGEKSMQQPQHQQKQEQEQHDELRAHGAVRPSAVRSPRIGGLRHHRHHRRVRTKMRGTSMHEPFVMNAQLQRHRLRAKAAADCDITVAATATAWTDDATSVGLEPLQAEMYRLLDRLQIIHDII